MVNSITINSSISNSNMKRFIYIICIYVFAVLLVILPVEFYKIYTHQDLGHVAGSEVRAAIKVSKTKTDKKVRKLLLGDSTGHALYPSWSWIKYDSIVSLTCNQAITFAGHYFLLNDYLATNPDNFPQEIILLVTPESFGNDVDKYAYQYFLKSFPIHEYKPLYTDHLYARIKTIPFYWTANLPFIQTSGYTPRVSVPAYTERVHLSQLTYEYLLLIDSLTKVNNIPFHIISTPVREDRRQQLEKVAYDLKTIAFGRLSHLIDPYVKSITYFPADLFFDEVHLNDKDTPEDYLGILK